MSQPKLKPAMATEFPGKDHGPAVFAIIIGRDGQGLWKRWLVKYPSIGAALTGATDLMDESPSVTLASVQGRANMDIYKISQE